MSRRDLVIIGGGTAGLVASVTAAGVGARVTLIERERTGGDCLWTGCVPSKSLLAAAEAAHTMRTADRFGITPVEPEVDLARVMATVRERQATIEPHDSPERLRSLGVEVVHGHGRFVDDTTVDVDGQRLSFRRAAIATGSEPALPPVEGLADVETLTSDTVWELTSLPERLVVLGGGPIGCELGQAFARLGSRVTLVEMTDSLLPQEMPEAGRVVAARLEAEGVDVRVATTAVRAEQGRLTVSRDGVEETLEHDALLVATGRRPRTQRLGLDAAGVATSRAGHVRVDDRLRTTNRRIYAAGDVTGRLPFTHVAGRHGASVAIDGLFGVPRRVSEDRIPWATFTDPEVARVGMTPAQARTRWGDECRVRTQTLAEVDRAITAGATDGFATLVGDPKGRLVGATVVAPSAGESITEVVARMATDGTIADIGMTTHAYPTFSEAQNQAGLEAVRERWQRPAVLRVTRPLLALLRWLDRG